MATDVIPQSPGQRRPRRAAFGLANSAVALLILIALVIISSASFQNTPPAIAELAPQVQQIKPPLGAAALNGKGPGGDEQIPGSIPASASPGAARPGASPTVDALQVRRCVGNPPRQIEDPQSPPCVGYYTGNNGGATSKGVTKDSIVLAYDQYEMKTYEGNPNPQDWVNFFNKRFEFYGRKIVLKPFDNLGAEAPTAPQQEADATMVDTQLGAFAEIMYAAHSAGTSTPFFDELARRKIVSVQSMWSSTSASNQDHYSATAPYEWAYLPTPDQIGRNIAEMVCNQLVHKSPKWAGVPQSTQSERKFGVLRGTTAGFTPVDFSAFDAGVARCGVKPVNIDFNGATEQNSIASMASQNVTTVICLCDGNQLSQQEMIYASAQHYYPEWIVQDYSDGQDEDSAPGLMPQDQVTHIMTLKSWNKTVRRSDTPQFWAQQEMDPGAAATLNQNFLYWDLLLIASGIQMAGPNLTPQTFEQGLFRTQFPNPGAGAAPYYQGTVGFGPGNHSMVDDFGLAWFSLTDPPPDSSAPGAYCYVDKGRRFSLGNWPVGDAQLYTGAGTCAT